MECRKSGGLQLAKMIDLARNFDCAKVYICSFSLLDYLTTSVVVPELVQSRHNANYDRHSRLTVLHGTDCIAVSVQRSQRLRR